MRRRGRPVRSLPILPLQPVTATTRHAPPDPPREFSSLTDASRDLRSTNTGISDSVEAFELVDRARCRFSLERNDGSRCRDHSSQMTARRSRCDAITSIASSPGSRASYRGFRRVTAGIGRDVRHSSAKRSAAARGSVAAMIGRPTTSSWRLPSSASAATQRAAWSSMRPAPITAADPRRDDRKPLATAACADERVFPSGDATTPSSPALLSQASPAARPAPPSDCSHADLRQASASSRLVSTVTAMTSGRASGDGRPLPQRRVLRRLHHVADPPDAWTFDHPDAEPWRPRRPRRRRCSGCRETSDRETRGRRARRARRTSRGPSAVKSRLPILKPPTTPAQRVGERDAPSPRRRHRARLGADPFLLRCDVRIDRADQVRDALDVVARACNRGCRRAASAR